MRRDWLSLAGLALSVALVTAPFWLLPHAGEASTTYTVERIEYEPGVDGFLRAGGPVDGLDCDSGELRRGCLFAQHVVDEGPVTVDVTGVGPTLRGQFTSPPYVVAHATPPFYRRNVTPVDPGEASDRLRVRYALEPIGPETVLSDISVAERRLPRPLRGLRDGETTTVHGKQLEAGGTVFRADGAYYLVRATDHDDADWERWHALLARGVLFLGGLGLLRARWRAPD
jgi:hypothetical protein